MATPVRRALLGVARGWRQFGRLCGGTLCSRSLAVEAAPSSSGSPWRLLGALCLQRPPLISKPLTPLQEEMATLLQQVVPRCGLQGDEGNAVAACGPWFYPSLCDLELSARWN